MSARVKRGTNIKQVGQLVSQSGKELVGYDSPEKVKIVAYVV